MKFRNFLNEKYLILVDFKYSKSPPFPVYMNPGSSDYIDMKKTKKEQGVKFFYFIRFIIDLDKKNIYVFDAGEAMHMEVEEKLRHKGLSLSNNILYGIGPLSGSKIEIEGLYQEPWKVPQNYDYKWAKRYFTNPQNIIDIRMQAYWD